MNTQKWFRDQPDPLVRVEVGVTRIQARGPCIQIGDYLAQIKAMRLTHVQTFDPNVWRPNRVLSVPQIDLSAHTDRKMVNLYVYLCNYFTKKSRFYSDDTR